MAQSVEVDSYQTDEGSDAPRGTRASFRRLEMAHPGAPWPTLYTPGSEPNATLGRTWGAAEYPSQLGSNDCTTPVCRVRRFGEANDSRKGGPGIRNGGEAGW